MARRLVLHADDLGIAQEANEASFQALRQGWVSSASAIVPSPYFSEVARFARKNKQSFDIGVHLAFTSEWRRRRLRPCSDPRMVRSLVDQDGFLHASVKAFARRASAYEVRIEAEAQMLAAIQQGLFPSHLDSHMFALYARRDLTEAALSVSRAYGIPFLPSQKRIFSLPSDTHPSDHLKTCIETILRLPSGLSTFVVHLARRTPALSRIMGRDTPFGASWRERDLEFVGSYFLPGFLKKCDIQLVNWKQLREKF